MAVTNIATLNEDGCLLIPLPIYNLFRDLLNTRMCFRWILISAMISMLEANNIQQTMDAKAVSSAIAQFSAKFYKELPTDKSVVSSPLSAEYLLALLALGSTDPAHSELLLSLGIADDDTIRSSFSTVSTKLKAIKGVTLDVANKVYIQDGDYDLDPELKKDAVKIFDAAIEKVNFGKSAAAVKNINDWVACKTKNKIKDLLSEDSIDSFTRLVLVNALYFKGTWKDQFNRLATTNQAFHLTATTTKDIPMMYNEATYSIGFSELLQVRLLELPYIGEQASMLIVLPNEIEGLNDVVAKLAAGHDLMADVANMYKTKVQVTMPKFKIETTIDLNELLPKLGISAIFSQNNSGLTKILNTSEPLYVSKAVQKAYIEVNEEGAEAAAATAIGVAALSAIIDLTTVELFVADRPFLAVIFIDGAPYFMATYRGDEE